MPRLNSQFVPPAPKSPSAVCTHEQSVMQTVSQAYGDGCAVLARSAANAWVEQTRRTACSGSHAAHAAHSRQQGG